MTTIDTSFYEKKKTTTFYVAVAFLIFVILLTGGLYLYSKHLQNTYIDIQDKIQTRDTAISGIESNTQIQLYSMYQQHKGFFEDMKNKSQIPLFVSHLKKQFAKYGIQAGGFEYEDGETTLDLSSQTNEAGYAYKKIVKFVEEYAVDDKAIFTLGPIVSFSGYDRINFQGTFYLK